MILIKCQIRSKYEWLRNSTPEKVFREFSPLIVLLALRNVRIFIVYGLNAISEPEPVLLCPGLRRQQLPRPVPEAELHHGLRGHGGRGRGHPGNQGTDSPESSITRLLLQHFENVMENDVIENDEEGNDNICYEAIDENNEDYLDMNCGNK